MLRSRRPDTIHIVADSVLRFGTPIAAGFAPSAGSRLE